MSFDRRIQKALSAVPVSEPEPFDSYLEDFTDEERATIHAIHAQVGGADLREFLRRCSDEQYGIVRGICMQAVARAAPEPEPAFQYVESKHDPEQLAAFLAIDESRMPNFDDAPLYEGRYHYATQYRHDKWMVQRHISLNNISREDREIVRRWVTLFG